MGRKKGRQAGYFTSKSKRAAFVTEWQSQVVDVRQEHQQQQKQGYVNKLTTPSSSSSSCENTSNTVRLQQQHEQEQQRPKFRWTHLHHVLNERQQQQQQHQQEDPYIGNNNREETNDYTSTSSSLSLTSSLNIYDDENDSYRECGLVLLCIETLAPVLSQYVRAMGRNVVHYYLSLLPDKTLTALSVELSVRNLWSIDLLYVVTQHDCLRRLAIWWNNNDNNDDNNPNDDKRGRSTAVVDLEQALILQPPPLLPQQQQERVVPDSWEDEVTTFHNDQFLLGPSCATTVATRQHSRRRSRTLRKLQRLDMRNIPPFLLSSLDAIVSLINSRHTTHLTLHVRYQNSTTTSITTTSSTMTTTTTLGRRQQHIQQQQQYSALVNYLIVNEFHLVHLNLVGYGGAATGILPIGTKKSNISSSSNRRRCHSQNNVNKNNDDDDDNSDDEWNL